MRFRFGQVLARANSTLSAVRLVRNLSESHIRILAMRRCRCGCVLRNGPSGVVGVHSFFVQNETPPSGRIVSEANGSPLWP